ncbi:MAG TPA: transposase [Parachlamydiaceae bacterium]|nr:transposase [Parachlamydiaceae bacterium]
MSFRENLSEFWNNIHCNLFPQLEEDIGELSSEHKKLISILELVRIEDFIPCTKFNEGRPIKERKAIARANIAKIVFKFSYTKQLVKYLNIDKQLKSICGFDAYKKVPSDSTFSRAFKEFTNSSLPEKVHQVLIKGAYKDQVIFHVAIDSTPLEAREKHLKKDTLKNRNKLKAAKKRARKAGALNRREQQLKEKDIDKMILDLPIQCDKGMKKSAQGNTRNWKGYKLHAAVDDNCIPLAIIVTSASVNDCEVAIPLMLKSKLVLAQNFYYLMDAAYDHPEIAECSISLGSVSIIDLCPENANEKIEKEAEKERKKLLNFQTAEDKRYKERFPKERFNASYKDYNGGSHIIYKGHAKVTCHVMFGALTFAAATIISLIQ